RMSTFTEEEVVRYARHIILPQIGGEGQRRLLDSSVLCVGAGGLGSPIAMYLAAAGVGKLGVVDFDKVDLTNLQRQILHGTSDVGRPKVESAADTLRELNPGLEVVPHDVVLSSENAFDVLGPYDVVIDGSDNFPVRYLVNDATQMDFQTVRIRRDPSCPVCGDEPTVTELIDYEQFCGLTPGQAPPEAEHGVPVTAGESA